MRYGALGFLFITCFLFLLAIAVKFYIVHQFAGAFLSLLLAVCCSVFSWQAFSKWNSLF